MKKKVALTTGWILAIGCMVAALGTRYVGSAKTGIPVNTVEYERDGRYFYTHRGGRALYDRPATEVSETAYRASRAYDRATSLLIFFGVALAFCLGVPAILAARRRGAGGPGVLPLERGDDTDDTQGRSEANDC